MAQARDARVKPAAPTRNRLRRPYLSPSRAPSTRHPGTAALVKAMAPFLTAGDGQVRFEFGLSVLVAGLDSLKHWTPDQRDST